VPKRKGEPPSLRALPFHDARRLEIVERTPSGRARLYRDTVTGKRLTQYAVQKARNAGLTPKQAATLRKTPTPGRATQNVTERVKSLGKRATTWADRFAQAQGTNRTVALTDPKFWKAVSNIKGKPGDKRERAWRALGYPARRLLPGDVKLLRARAHAIWNEGVDPADAPSIPDNLIDLVAPFHDLPPDIVDDFIEQQESIAMDDETGYAEE
jgi:hypothetical protein